MKNIFALFVTAVVCISCSMPKEKIPPVSAMEMSSDKIIVYQLFVRLFGNKIKTNKPYGTLEENGAGKFNDISDNALQKIKEMGVTHIWYTGVIEHATLTDYTPYGIPADDPDVVKGRAGSPYAVKDYYDVDPDLAINVPDRMKEFEALVERTHKNKLKLLIDFIPNHVARAYYSDKKPAGTKDLGEDDDRTVAFSPRNNFYYLPGESFTPPRGYAPLGKGVEIKSLDGKFDETPAKVTGNDQFTASPGVNEWFETAKLNYGVDIQNGRKTYFDPVPDTWVKMRDILLFWTNKKIDGFRCDMAEMVPVEFWGWVIPQIKLVNPEIIFVAEIYNPSLYQDYVDKGRFTYLYDKVELYDTLRLLTMGQGKTSGVADIQKKHQGFDNHLLHFIENHDEQRAASRFFAGDPWKAIPAMVVSATIDRGAVMIYFGQEVGEPALGAEGFQGDDGRTSIFDYWGVPEHQKWMNGGTFNGDSLSDEQKQLRQFYVDLLNLAANNPAFTRGDYHNITVTDQSSGHFNDKVLSYIRHEGDERLLILASFNTEIQPIKVQIPADVVDKIELDPAGHYIARDLLWHEVEVGFDRHFTFDLNIKPYSALILKIK